MVLTLSLVVPCYGLQLLQNLIEKSKLCIICISIIIKWLLLLVAAYFGQTGRV